MSDTMPVLLPCPLCGWTAIIGDDEWDKGIYNYWVVCVGCAYTGPRADNAVKAVTAWNRRPGGPAK